MKVGAVGGRGIESENAPTRVQVKKISIQAISTRVVMKVLDIGIERQAVHPHTIVTMMIFLMMEVSECLQAMEDMDLGLKRPAAIPLGFMDFIVAVTDMVIMEEVDIYLSRDRPLFLSQSQSKC